MARKVTLEELITRCKRRADMENSTFIGDEEWTQLINDSRMELRDLLIVTNEDFFFTTEDITTASGTQEYDLPEDFYKLRGVDMLEANGDVARSIRKYEFSERNLQRNRIDRVLTDFRYHLQGEQIRLIPKPSTAQTLRLHYYPVPDLLEDDDDEVEGVAGFDEYIVIDVAIKALTKEESSTEQLERQLTRMRKRIEWAAQHRDVGEPSRVVEIEEISGRYFRGDY